MNEIQEEILKEISYSLRDIKVDCPACKYMDDDQYTCTTCWKEGGNGKINAIEYLKEHPHLIEKLFNKDNQN